MNYPLRFVVFGMVLVTACHFLRNHKWFSDFWELTYVVGLLYLFLSLWLLSIFGNYGTIDSWWKIKQISLFYWGIIRWQCAGGFMLYGLKSQGFHRPRIRHNFPDLIFIYTKYFEYFWDSTNHTAVFCHTGGFILADRKKGGEDMECKKPH